MMLLSFYFRCHAMQNKIQVLSFDYDSCLLHTPKLNFRENYIGNGYYKREEIPTGFDIIEGNRDLLNSIKNSNVSKIVLIGSNRQDLATNQFNKFNNGGDCYVDIPEVAKYINAEFDPFLMADIYGDLKDGESYQRAIDPNYKGGHRGWRFDETKASLLYAQMHKIAQDHPNCEEIVFDFYDDKTSILQSLNTFFNKYHELIPKNITLNLYKYTGNMATCQSTIQGTGLPDSDYRDTVKEMATIADPNGYQEKICIANSVTPELLHKKKQMRKNTANPNTLPFIQPPQQNDSDTNIDSDEEEEHHKTASACINFCIRFHKFMSHPATKAVLFILLVAALAVLTYGLVGVGLAVAAGTAIGTAAIASTAAGGGTVLASSIGLGISFFSSREKNEKTENQNLIIKH